MPRTLILSFLFQLCRVALTQTYAQEPPPRIKVHFECQCDDPTGRLFAMAFRDALAKSPRYIETDFAEKRSLDGKSAEMYWNVKAVSTDASIDNDGASAALSIVVVFGDTFFVAHSVILVGRSRAEAVAKDALAFFDERKRRWVAAVSPSPHS